jgi:hypothetical protein
LHERHGASDFEFKTQDKLLEQQEKTKDEKKEQDLRSEAENKELGWGSQLTIDNMRLSTWATMDCHAWW